MKALFPLVFLQVTQTLISYYFSLIVCSLCFLFVFMDHISSGEYSKPQSPQKAFIMGELAATKRFIKQKNE